MKYWIFVIFVIDIIINFNTGYYDKVKNLIIFNKS